MAARKPAAKAKAGASKRKAPGTSVAGKGRARTSKAATKATPDAVSGRHRTIAQRMLRDSRIVQRVIQGWPWEAIATEAGLSVAGAKKAYASRHGQVPMALSIDPVKVIEGIAEGYQLSIGDLEAIAADAVVRNQLAVAVGAKKGANDARDKLVHLLQATGRLPQDLAALRHLIDLRALGVRMLDVIDAFEEEVRLLEELPPDQRERATMEAAGKIRTTFYDLLGIGAPDAVEGHAIEAGAPVG